MTQNILTTSAGTLARSAEHKPTFSPVHVSVPEAFDEGPVVLRWKGDSTSSDLNHLSSSYPFLQGVEITKHSQYAAGLFKIWSGDPQHCLKQSVFGQERVFTQPRFVETDRFSALALVRDHVTTLTNDNDGPIESYDYNGVIEPLTIRKNVASSTHNNAEPMSVKGSLLGGTIDHTGASCEVLSVDVVGLPIVVPGFIDGTMKLESTTRTPSSLFPFSDARLPRSVPVPASEPADMVAAISMMSGTSTDGYVHHDQRSAPCGWYYDNNSSVGTDSLAFGGMTH